MFEIIIAILVILLAIGGVAVAAYIIEGEFE